MFASGTKIIVLGHKRCFFCGVEINPEEVESRKLKQNTGSGLVITNLCEKCYKLGEKLK
jgi:hypothetical protein